MRLLLNLAGSLPSWKKRAAPVRRLLNIYCHVSAKDTRYRHATAYNTEKDSSTVKDPRRATQTQKPCYSVTQCIRAAFANIIVVNISAPPWQHSQIYSVSKILQHTVSICRNKASVAQARKVNLQWFMKIQAKSQGKSDRCFDNLMQLQTFCHTTEDCIRMTINVTPNAEFGIYHYKFHVCQKDMPRVHACKDIVL